MHSGDRPELAAYSAGFFVDSEGAEFRKAQVFFGDLAICEALGSDHRCLTPLIFKQMPNAPAASARKQAKFSSRFRAL
jgi:hypothetical protein